MAVLSAKDFMDKVKSLLGDRDDDEALSFLEDCKDTISDSKNDYKEKYEAAIKEKEELDKSWRTKYKERFYESDNDNPSTKDKEKEKEKDLFDTRSEEQKKAESITVDDLFKESEE